MNQRRKNPPVTFDVGVTVNRQGSPALDCNFAIPRILGTSASLTADASISSFIAHSFNLQYALPGLFKGNWKFFVNAVKQVNDYCHTSSFSEEVTGLSLGFARGSHKLSLEAHLRDIHPLISLQGGANLVASEEVRRVALRSVKSSLAYSYLLDRVVGEYHPTGGYKLQLNTDASGVFGDVRLWKFLTSFQTHLPLWGPNIVLHSRVSGGAIAHFDNAKTPIQDRFFLGGTADEISSFRGFQYRSIGPAGKRIPVENHTARKEKQFDHLGGDAFVSIDNVVSFPVYANLKEGIDIRGMAYVQAASIVPQINSTVSSDLGENVRVTAGLGVRVPLGSAGLVELSLGKPIFGLTKSDSQQFVQIGLRLSNRM